MSIPDAVTVQEHEGSGPESLEVEVLLTFEGGAAVDLVLTAEQTEKLLVLARAQGHWPRSVAVVTMRRASGCGVTLIYDRRSEQ